jgi:murein DD-endopeptidase MepM/ murein hydrolase activator NlpD
MRAAVLLLAVLPTFAVGPAARAGMPDELGLPIDCTPGEDCWIVRYVDHDPGPGVRDYMCGAQTGDGHKGTDIAIRDLEVMARGVEVRAAAAGVVDALRDGVPDVGVEQAGAAAIAGKECGNAIRIAHGDGWTTWYCHLRRGSLLVGNGDRVAAGQPLALVGLSGATSFPHVHFDVRHGDQVVDPFVGPEPAGDCGPGKDPLWRADVMAALAYQPVVLTNAGFAPAAPELAEVERGSHRRTDMPASAPALVLWVEGYWLAAGDRARFTISGPDGAPVVDRPVVLGKGWQHWFQFVGARRPGDAWPAGDYTGSITLERAGRPRVTLQRRVELR